MTPDPRERFTGRVADYLRSRPGYPPQVAARLAADCGLGPGSTVADLGSGTGLLARLFLDAGLEVIGVEPNEAMRRAGERSLAAFPRFTSVAGSAEATGLPDRSVDLAAAGQAFHWFDRPRTRSELERILRPGGWVALVWNERRKRATPFLAAYERLLLDFGTDYREIDHSRIGAAELAAFFHPGRMRAARFDNRQGLDLPGLRARLLSSSYAPPPGHPGHRPMLAALGSLFEAHQRGGRVELAYDTRLFYGRLDGGSAGEAAPPGAR